MTRPMFKPTRIPGSRPVAPRTMPVAKPATPIQNIAEKQQKVAGTVRKPPPPPGPVFQRVPGHLALIARAGSGKTFSLLEGINRQLGRPTPGIVGTDQQETFWEQLCRGPRPRKILILAFNRSVKAHARELVKRAGLNDIVDVQTSHAFGLITCKKNRAVGEVDKWKMSKILEEITEKDYREMNVEFPGFAQLCCTLCRLCKVNLIGLGMKEAPVATPEILDRIVGHFGMNVPDEYVEAIYECVPAMLSKGIEVADKMIDYEDMISLPIVKKLEIYRYDQVMVDEVQDLTAASRQLSYEAGSRVIICGDPAQAVYGFSGADCDSMNNYLLKLQKSVLGCTEFPLTKTRRCGTEIVALAREIVPDIEAIDGAHAGEVVYSHEEEYLDDVEDGDMVICRTNAPLVSGVMRIIRQRRKAFIEGRDTGDDLTNIIKRLEAQDIEDLAGKIDDWYMTEIRKLRKRKFTSQESEIALSDKRDCLLALMDGCKTVKEVLKAIDEIFKQTTDDGKSPEGIRFSSIHRAKGLEAPTVHFLQHNKCPHPMATTDWQMVQEWNLRYVAITRAMRKLVLIQSAKRERPVKEDE